MFSIDKSIKKYYNNSTHLPINTTGVPSDRQRFRVGRGPMQIKSTERNKNE